MANSYNLYRYHELKKRLEKKEKEDIYEELIKMEREKLVWEI